MKGVDEVVVGKTVSRYEIAGCPDLDAFCVAVSRSLSQIADLNDSVREAIVTVDTETDTLRFEMEISAPSWSAVEQERRQLIDSVLRVSGAAPAGESSGSVATATQRARALSPA